MKSASVIAGSGATGVMVLTPAPGMANSIVSSPAAPAAHSPAIAPEAVFVLAARIASRRVQKPSLAPTPSAVVLTVIVFARTEAAARKRTATWKRCVIEYPSWRTVSTGNGRDNLPKRVGSLEQALADRFGDGFRLGMDLELVVDVLQVERDGVDADAHGSRGSLLVVAVDQELQKLR